MAKGKGRFRTLPVCMLKLRKFESMYRGSATEASARVDYISTITVGFIVTRRGLACVAYLYIGAMRRPEYRDRRGRNKLPRLFYFQKFYFNVNAKFGSSGSAEAIIVC